MAVAWTPHRFSGGLLALDTTNTVVLRGAPESFDRFAEPREIARFAEAASGFRAAELGGRRLAADDPRGIHGLVVEMREATDGLFRDSVLEGGLRADLLADFLAVTGRPLKGRGERIGAAQAPFGGSAAALPFEAAVAVSALSLLTDGLYRRVRICQHCRWLFVDRSRNSSRLWCDMAVCGNRNKARRHYRRRRAVMEENAHDA
ncbi:MAG: CGNR zinc finger domain-containing protein [Rhizobiaceae bacterium]